MVIIVAAGAGLILGSFLSVFIERWPKWRGAVAGRSHCPHCRHQLAASDLIPLVSWAMLRGRCRYCKERISAMYPAFETAAAAVFGVGIWQAGFAGWETVGILALLFGFVALFFFDLRWMVLPDAILAAMAALALVLNWSARGPALLAAAVLVLIFGLLHFASRGHWIGLGDVKMAAVVGLCFQLRGAMAVTLVAIWAGALVGILLMALGRATRKTALPLGTFWSAASILFILWPAPFMRLADIFIPTLQ